MAADKLCRYEGKLDRIDDFYVSLLLLCQGHQVVRASDVRAYELSAVDRRDEFWRKVRIACQAFNVSREVS